MSRTFGVGGVPRIVLRRPSGYVFGWLAFVVLLLFVVLVVLFTSTSGALTGMVAGGGVMRVLLWFVRLVGICSRIEVSDEGLVVDGREVAPSVGGGSLISALMNNSTQRRMVDAIAARRPAVAPVVGSAVRRRLDVQPWGFLVMLAVFVALAVVVHQFG